MADVSITDIAKAAGVSPSTVSRALAGHDRISVERRAEIQALAHQMGYRPCQVARSLVTGQTRTLGVVVTDITDPFVAEVLTGAEVAARAAGYTLLFASSHRDPEREVEAAALLAGRQVDGMLVISSRSDGRYCDLHRRNTPAGKGLPVVLVNNDQNGPQVHSVRMDNRAGARAAVAYLRALGHSRITFLAGPEGGRSSEERLQGYRDEMEAGRCPRESWLVLPGRGQLEDGAAAVAALRQMAAATRPTAVLCYNDLAAMGLLAAAHEVAWQVPDDLSIVGYDNIPLSAFTIPALTTVHQPTQKLGQLAVESCLAALIGMPIADAVLTGELIIRDSAAAPRAAG